MQGRAWSTAAGSDLLSAFAPVQATSLSSTQWSPSAPTLFLPLHNNFRSVGVDLSALVYPATNAKGIAMLGPAVAARMHARPSPSHATYWPTEYGQAADRRPHSTLTQLQLLNFASRSPPLMACLSNLGLSVLGATPGGRAQLFPALFPGGLPLSENGAVLNDYSGLAELPLMRPHDRMMSASASTSALSSDDTASRGSEPCGSSDGSDSGDKKIRAWKIMLTAQQAVQIYQNLPADTLHITSKSVVVGKQFGVSAKTIRDIWKRETWVKATRGVWSPADEHNYQEQEAQKVRASAAPSAPPGSVASLLADDLERSPSPNGDLGAGSRARGRPKGVKDSRPRKRRCENERGISVTSSSSHTSSDLSSTATLSSSYSSSPCGLGAVYLNRHSTPDILSFTYPFAV